MDITNEQELLKSLESIENLVSRLEVKYADKIGPGESDAAYFDMLHILNQLKHVKVRAVAAQGYVKLARNQTKELKRALADMLLMYEGVYDSVKPGNVQYQSDAAKQAERNARDVLYKHNKD